MSRNWKTVLRATCEFRHYYALINMLIAYQNPVSILRIYLTGKGQFPITLSVKAPVGLLDVTLYHYHDLLTFNEIFCRRDYGSDKKLRCVVDIGSNIGISLLYFLSRNKLVKAYGYEPVPENMQKLRLQMNANKLSHRLEYFEKAVSHSSGEKEFGIEMTGRYGGLDRDFATKIRVDTLHINQVIEKVLQKEKKIDLLKLDTEGSEEKILKAIDKTLLKKIDRIYAEDVNLCYNSHLFIRKKYGHITLYKNRHCA